MDVILVVLATIGALVLLVVLAIVGLVASSRKRLRQGFARQKAQWPRFPGWGEARGLTYQAVGADVPAKELIGHIPFSNFDSPGNFVAYHHVFSGRVDGRRRLVLQLTVRADPRPGAGANGALSVAVAELPSSASESQVTGNGRSAPHIHVKGRWVTSYLGGPLTLDRAALVHDRLVEYLDTTGTSA